MSQTLFWPRLLSLVLGGGFIISYCLLTFYIPWCANVIVKYQPVNLKDEDGTIN